MRKRRREHNGGETKGSRHTDAHDHAFSPRWTCKLCHAPRCISRGWQCDACDADVNAAANATRGRPDVPVLILCGRPALKAPRSVVRCNVTTALYINIPRARVTYGRRFAHSEGITDCRCTPLNASSRRNSRVPAIPGTPRNEIHAR